MKFNIKFLTILILACAQSGHGAQCFNKDSAPLCPNSGSTLLDETYPTQAFVISNSSRGTGLLKRKVTSNYIATIAKSYDFENLPQILVPTDSFSEFEEVKKDVQKNLELRKIAPDKILLILNQMEHIDSKTFTWQQDYFESFVDLNTGSPVIREFQSYQKSGFNQNDVKKSVEKIVEKGALCSIAKGAGLSSTHMADLRDLSLKEEIRINSKEKKKGIKPILNDIISKHDISFNAGEMGGNVEGAPGGHCLIGDNMSRKLAKEFCGNDNNIIQLQVSWMKTGHVDEIFKIIPSHFNDNRPKECQFSLMSASPKKALDLLGQSANKSKHFYTFSNQLNEEEINDKKMSRIDSRGDGIRPGNALLCSYIERAIKEGSMPKTSPSTISPGGVKSVFLDILLNKAHANEFNCKDYIDQVTNGTILEYMQKDQNFIDLNNAIQESIDNDKKLIKGKILARLPQCEKYFDFLDVPDLFYGPAPIKKNDKLELVRPGIVNSLLPNPTNSVLMNRTLLVPETANSTFDMYIEEELRKRKIKMETIDSWEFAHAQDGNIHCSSHSITYCQPRK